MANAWFETVAEAQRRAQKRLPKSVYGALVAGSEKGLSSRDNLDSFDQLGFAPHIAGLSGQRDMAVSVMGQQLAFRQPAFKRCILKAKLPLVVQRKTVAFQWGLVRLPVSRWKKLQR